MLSELKRRAEATAALNQAIALYRDWGAAAKADALTAELGALGGH
jgi:hypothetical protein